MAISVAYFNQDQYLGTGPGYIIHFSQSGTEDEREMSKLKDIGGRSKDDFAAAKGSLAKVGWCNFPLHHRSTRQTVLR